MEYWRGELEGVQELRLPTDAPRNDKACSRGGWLELNVDERVVVALELFAARSGATMFMVLLSALQLLLGARCGQDDVVVSHQFEFQFCIWPCRVWVVQTSTTHLSASYK